MPVVLLLAMQSLDLNLLPCQAHFQSRQQAIFQIGAGRTVARTHLLEAHFASSLRHSIHKFASAPGRALAGRATRFPAQRGLAELDRRTVVAMNMLSVNLRRRNESPGSAFPC